MGKGGELRPDITLGVGENGLLTVQSVQREFPGCDRRRTSATFFISEVPRGRSGCHHCLSWSAGSLACQKNKGGNKGGAFPIYPAAAEPTADWPKGTDFNEFIFTSLYQMW